ncbi:predicted protein [Uncinocarpus reesii 1704]|uniref:Hemerythrin-like domain-containing protein n=1 Tax=Uncinocarpus reesii (strain UAMH 1704) TaxID=336963 RepID=C4JVE0_UNCRE|nr:uncharacterized protein UREG_06532 [Uncinocarpus reesii 1704]EEP81667.1 predicted protein [Uncinocarpus reesii 1704]
MPEPWADTPLSLIADTGFQSRSDIPPNHGAIHFARNMACLHNLLLRSFNASYNQCLRVKKGTKEAADFLIFNQIMYESITHHHHIEEEYMFPRLEQITGVKGIMDQNIQEHKDFEGGLHKLSEYVFNTDASSYDGETLKGILEILGPVLEKHLHAEIPTLLDLGQYDTKALMGAWEFVSKKAEAGLVQSRTGMMALSCIDKTFVLDGEHITFPKFPAFVPYLAKYIFKWPHAGSWRFAPCDGFGNPRPLPFSASSSE